MSRRLRNLKGWALEKFFLVCSLFSRFLNLNINKPFVCSQLRIFHHPSHDVLLRSATSPSHTAYL